MSKHTTLEQMEKLAKRTKSELDGLDSQVKGYGYQTDEDVQNAINAKIGSAYSPGGSYTFETLPEPSEDTVGKVYDVSNEFTTDTRFLHGADKTYPAGTNIVVVEENRAFKFDVLSGFVDLSGLQPKEAGKGLSQENFTTELKNKLDDIETASNEDVDKMLNEVFGGS